jgi:hypothetical protein
MNKFKINTSQVVHETIDGETILLNLESGSYFSLDSLGGIIWEFLEADVSPGKIIEELKRQFQSQENEIESSVEKFICDLVGENLVISIGNEETNDKDTTLDENLINKLKALNDSIFSPPQLTKYTDMQDILQLDPIHDVDEATGWPVAKQNENNH